MWADKSERCWKRNMEGLEFEKAGDIGKAIRLYEENV
jgi:hypothetical protein